MLIPLGNRFRYFLKNYWLLFLILAIYLFFALYKLDAIPGEIWNDAIVHYNLAAGMMHGNFFYNYAFGGDGPLYTYIVVMVAQLFGLSFLTLKLTSVFIGFFFILSLYFLTWEFFKNKHIAYLAGFLAAISFWSIMFARQPHARILVPLFVTLTILFAIRKRTLLSGIFLGIGMYTQASFWGTLLIFLAQPIILAIGLLMTVPLLYSFTHSSVHFFSNASYFGEKLATSDHFGILETVRRILSNMLSNLLSFTSKGDGGFRLNIPYAPHLDRISGIFFLIGIFTLIYHSIKRKDQNLLRYFFLPFILIQIPSILDIHNYSVQPNIGRLIGILPFTLIAVAYGIYFSVHLLVRNLIANKTNSKTYSTGIIVCLVSILALLNFYRYFIIYPKTLPNNNTPFGKIIAQTIDTYPANTQVIVVGSGWGAWGQPEVAGIPMVQKTVHSEAFVATIAQAAARLCSASYAPETPIRILSDPNFQQQLATADMCIKKGKLFILKKNSWDIAVVLEGVAPP